MLLNRIDSDAECAKTMNISKPNRVLVVEDEPEFRGLLVNSLQKKGVTVASTGEVREAIAMVSSSKPDLIITDIFLANSSGFDLLDAFSDIPAVVITGSDDASVLLEASRRNPVKLLTKPLNLAKLQMAVLDKLNQLEADKDSETTTVDTMRETCVDLVRDSRKLSKKILQTQTLVEYQQLLISARTDDDVFYAFYSTFVRKCGPVSGISALCDTDTSLSISGRFGVPQPDSLRFRQCLAQPVIDMLLDKAGVQVIDALENCERFDESIKQYLPGLTILAIPLLPCKDKLAGAIILYRKGEQPFDYHALQLAGNFALPTALALHGND